ncbi:MAG: CoA activase [candidate division Zixibacteria bacterium]|nr:CoA activase [candidate division Zixibacteria bacterium]
MEYLGIDIGSISISVAAIDSGKNIISTSYIRHQGAPEKALKQYLTDKDLSRYDGIGFTGTGGKRSAELLDYTYINEIIATAAALVQYSPQTNSAIEMGGQGSKYYRIKDNALIDFSTSGLCAAGTGSFLDQQAGRLKVSIEDEFGRLALKSTSPPHIAGRCSVFAKSDMIHNQQIGTPDYDIIAGLCYAVVRNYRSTIIQKKILVKPVAFVGGVALNPGVVKAFKDELGLQDNELIIPENCLYFSALGAALKISETQIKAKKKPVKLKALDRKLTLKRAAEPLKYSSQSTKNYDITSSPSKITSDTGYLGVDIGSLSTNLVVIDSEGNVMARRYLMTEGRPIKTVQRGLKEVADELDGNVRIVGVGTTGSGRYLIGDILGADIVRNEITAQAKAAVFFDPKVDTVFEIGGQDSKYISIDNGTVVDFEMNKACAAGTGSFLQEQAERLDISIEEQFGSLALQSKCPVGCGERCTVFIESDIISHQQQGAPREDLVAGLAYSIVNNYLNKVVGNKRIGDNIFFQGGVAWNKGVVAAFENVAGKNITVPPHHDVTGAIGAALLAMENGHKQSTFKGFGVADTTFKQESFVCEDCANVCTIRKITSTEGKELFYGSRCGKYDDEKTDEESKKRARNNPTAWRNRLMFSYGKKVHKKPKGVIGIPRLLIHWAYWPFWATLFNELGFKVIGSAPTNNTIVREGAQIVGSETCFPVKVAHGHVLNLLTRNVDHIFLPSVINAKTHDEEKLDSYFCPYVQAIPYLVKAAMKDRLKDASILTPTIYFGYGDDLNKRQIIDIGKSLKCSKRLILKAHETAINAQDDFNAKLIDKGKEYLASFKGKKLIMVGRPYNTCDPGLNLELPKKIAALGALCLPPDMIPIDNTPVKDMYWHFGKTITRIADYVNKNNDIHAVYITNFGCGPDSFITHDFSYILKGKPFLTLELDEHSADAGLMTRCEAFLDSISGAEKAVEKIEPAPAIRKIKMLGRKLYVPRMSDLAEIFASALMHCGIEAEAMPESDEKTIELGRRYTNGKECYPAVLTTGDIIKLVQSPGFEHDRSAFFMPAAGGPCRFGQYHHLQKRLLDKLGYDNVPIYSPTSEDSYDDFPGASRGFRMLAWKGFVFGDHLYKLCMSARPGTSDKAGVESIFNKAYKAGCDDVVAGGENLKEILVESSRMFNRLDRNRKPRVKIGVVGEIYIRNNRFANNYLVDKLESFGAEVFIASLIEWVAYTTYMYKYHSLVKREYTELIKAYLQNYIQNREEHRVVKPIHGMLNGNSEKPMGKVLNYAVPYLSRSIGGEAVLSIGKAIDMVHENCGGIVNCMPFTCMPGNIVSALSSEISADLGGVPWLNITYEGPGDPTEDLKIEAFVDQAAAWQAKQRDKVFS